MDKVNNSTQDSFLPLLIQTINELIDTKAISIDSLCDTLNISRTHLHRRLKNLTGLSTTLFIRRIKMIRAKELLEKTDLIIAQIAYEVGVPSPQNLSKYFLSEFDISPTEYRKSIQSNRANHITDSSRLTDELTLYRPKKNSIAILPFETQSGAIGDAHFGDGIAEEIMYGLSQLKELHVAARASSFYFRNSSDSLKHIGRQLKVRHILTGNIRRQADKVRIMVSLMTAEDGFQIWTERYDKELKDIFEIQEQIAGQIVHKLKLTLVEEQSILKPKTYSINAYELYLKGREQFELRSDLDLSLQYFHRATLIDDTFVHAYFGMAYAVLYKCIFAGQRPKDAIESIQASCQKAMALDPLGAEGHIINAWIKFYFDYDFDGALAAMDAAIVADPNLMDAYRIKAYFYAFHGYYDLAIPLAEQAYQLDPLGYNAWFSLADILRRAGQYDRAIELFLPLIPKFPDNALLNEILALSYYYQGDLKSAEATFQNHIELPTQISIWTVGRYIYHFYHGDRTLLRDFLTHLQALQSKKWIQPTILALIHFHLGEEREAIVYLNQAYEERDFGVKHIITEPHWDLFRSHPAVQKVLSKST